MNCFNEESKSKAKNKISLGGEDPDPGVSEFFTKNTNLFFLGGGGAGGGCWGA